MMKPVTSLLILLVTAWGNQPFADAASGNLDGISESSMWRKLLQFNGDKHSEISNEDFFYAANGRYDPHEELQATLEAFRKNPTESACRFPARHQLLSRNGLIKPFDFRKCAEFMEWLGDEFPTSISLIFADGFLENPASYYGHMFVRVNSGQESFLLDSSLNFGAEVPDGENPVIYILKGLLGGYQASYSTQPFYRHDLSYGRVELRNLWDYQLDLSESQAMLLSAHLWELLRTDYQYFFASRNCAYFIARALELVTDDDLVSTNEFAVLPSEVMQRLSENSIDGHPALQSITLNESPQRRLQWQYGSLDQEEKRAVRQWIDTEDSSPSLLAGVDDENRRKRILTTLSSYYSFRKRDNPEESSFDSEEETVLLELVQLPAGNPFNYTASGTAPHQGQKPGLLRMSTEYTRHDDNRLHLLTRPAYYDRLQPAAGRIPHSSLSMMETELSLSDDSVRLERLWLLNIETLNISRTGLPGDGGRAWHIRAGADRHRSRGEDPELSAFLQGGTGQAWQFGPLTPYLMLNGRVHDKELSSDHHNLTVTPEAGFDLDLGPSRIHCALGFPQAINGQVNSLQEKLSCDINLYSGSSFDFRLGFERQTRTLTSASISYYF